MSTATIERFSTSDLRLDAAAEAARIADAIRSQVAGRLRRKGVVLGLSGGIDSSVTAALCVQALGPNRVLGVFMPERDGSRESLALGCLLAESLGIGSVLEDIGPTLETVGCYAARDAALARLFPEFAPGCKWKIVLPSLFDGAGYRVFSAVLQLPDGKLLRRRMPLDIYQEVVAATNYKQRVRKMIEYYHADRLHYAVAGTPNLLESDQGFFVKNGDGASDLKPIAHLYKTQVYQLAEHFDLPEAICRRPPTTDTYSLEQTQEEFFFSLPYDRMDACLYGRNHDVPADQVGEAVGLTPEQVNRVYADIDAKRRAARYLHEPPMCVLPPNNGA